MIKKQMIMGTLALVLSSCTTLTTLYSGKDIETLHRLACSQPKKSDSPWNIGNLYDCASRELFIPYQLWTGANWDGNKDTPCMHPADTFFIVNGRSRTTIKGPKQWENSYTGNTEIVWSRDKTDGSKQQYFVCHEKGIGRVYDRRIGRGTRYFETGRCKFPAGHGWKISVRRYCKSTSIEITSISLDEDHNLSDLQFKWWTSSTLDQKYRYVPNRSMTDAWEQ